MDSKISNFSEVTLAEAKALGSVVPLAVPSAPGVPGGNYKVPAAGLADAAALILLSGAMAPEYDPDSPYEGGSLVMKDYRLYRAVRDTAAGWTAADWEEKTIADLLKEYSMQPAYFKTQQLATYELSGADATAEFSPAADVTVQLARMDDGSGLGSMLSGAVKNTICSARLAMGGAGIVVSRAAKAATVDIDLVVPAAMASSGSDTVLQSLVLSVGGWGEPEPKQIVVPAASSATAWASGYQETKPIALVVKSTSEFTFSDFNIQDDFKEQVLPVYLELGIKADSFVPVEA